MALDWLPILPSVSRRKYRVSPQAETFGSVLPIPIPPPPVAMTWQPIYSARLLRRRLPVSSMPSVFGPIVVPQILNPVRWLPSYPARGAGRRRSVANTGIATSPPWSVFPAIARSMAWLPHYPDRLVRSRRAAAGSAVWVVDGTTLIDLQPCLFWEDGGVTQPEFAGEVVSSGGFADESLTQPDFGSEGIC